MAKKEIPNTDQHTEIELSQSIIDSLPASLFQRYGNIMEANRGNGNF